MASKKANSCGVLWRFVMRFVTQTVLHADLCNRPAIAVQAFLELVAALVARF